MLTSILHKLHYHCHYHSSNILQISFQHSSNILHPHHHSSIILQISFNILPTFFQYPLTSFQHLSTILQPSNTITPLYPILPSQSYVKKQKKVFQSRKRLYNHKCPFVCSFVRRHKAKPFNSLKSSSFILHPSSFFILHSSFIIFHNSSFILPSFCDF